MRQRNLVGSLIRVVTQSINEAEAALRDDDCRSAIQAVAHAYETRGRAEGYVQALREKKGRTGTTTLIDDKRLGGARLIRLRNQIAKSCKLR